MEDNWFSIQLANGSAGQLPLALVQIRSEYLTAVGPEEAIRVASGLIAGMGRVDGPPRISRIDLYADFGTAFPLADFPGSHWVKRSKKRSIHEECDEITGISFGSGNEVSARLYDKTREILKSGRDYLKPLWAAEGWTGAQVWRMEFQIRREGLPELMKGDASEALELCGNLWRYLCSDWLRLAVPSESDETRSRWPTHPLWEDLSRLWDIDPEAPPLTRVERARLPSDDFLFRAGISGLTSFMAREGIEDVGEGLGEFLHALEAYYGDPARQLPEGLQEYAYRKARLKARRYNVRIGRHGRNGRMRTYDLDEAARFLRMSPAVLRLHARQGRLRAAKPGKRWVFLEDDLAAYLHRLYAAGRQAPLSGSNQEKSLWGYTNAERSGGSISPRQTASEYVALLGLKTERSRRSTTTGSRSASGKSKGSASGLSGVGRTPPCGG